MRLLLTPVNPRTLPPVWPKGVRVIDTLSNASVLVDAPSSALVALKKSGHWARLEQPEQRGLPSDVQREHMPDVLLAAQQAKERLARLRAERAG